MILNAITTGEGAPVVLLHGLFGASSNWRTIQRHLAAAGRRVIALDLRNHGASPHVAGMGYGLMATDVAETLATLSALPAAVIGHSMGGKTAMMLALNRPEWVARLIVVDIAPLAYPPLHRKLVAAMAALPLLPTLSRRAADAALAAVEPDPMVRSFLLQNLRFDPLPHWRLGLGEVAAGMPELEDFSAPAGARYEGPTMFVRGGRSPYLREGYEQEIRAFFPTARIATINDAGHWVHWEAPEAFRQTVEAFLA